MVRSFIVVALCLQCVLVGYPIALSPSTSAVPIITLSVLHHALALPLEPGNGTQQPARSGLSAKE